MKWARVLLSRTERMRFAKALRADHALLRAAQAYQERHYPLTWLRIRISGVFRNSAALLAGISPRVANLLSAGVVDCSSRRPPNRDLSPLYTCLKRKLPAGMTCSIFHRMVRFPTFPRPVARPGSLLKNSGPLCCDTKNKRGICRGDVTPPILVRDQAPKRQQ